jgi:hypothetical protein
MLHIASSNPLDTIVNNHNGDYQQLINLFRNLPRNYSVKAVLQLSDRIKTNDARLRIEQWLWLTKKTWKNQASTWEELDLNNEQTMIIFWALFFSISSATQQLKLLWNGLTHPEIWELLRANFSEHLKKIITWIATESSVEEVRQYLKNQVIILTDSQWKPVVVSIYPGGVSANQASEAILSKTQW